MFATNTSFFVSDVVGLKLFSYGLVCSAAVGNTYMCIQTLKDGDYLLRTGAGYGELLEPNKSSARAHYKNVVDAMSEWKFCGLQGVIEQALYFNISLGKCLTRGTA